MHAYALAPSTPPSPAIILARRLAEISREQAIDARRTAQERGGATGREWQVGCQAFDAAERAWDQDALADAASEWGWAAGAFLRAAVVVDCIVEIPLVLPLPARTGAWTAMLQMLGPVVAMALFASGLASVVRREAARPAAANPTVVEPLAAVVESPLGDVVGPLPEVTAPDALAARADDAPPVVDDRPLGDWLRRYAVAWGQRDVLTLQRLGVLTSRVEAERLAASADSSSPLRATIRNVTSRASGERTIVSFDRTLVVARAAAMTDHLTFVLEPGLRGLIAFVPGRDEQTLARWEPPR